MLELLLVVGIAAVILVTAVSLFNQTSSDSKVTEAINQVQQISGAGYEWLQAQNQVDFCGDGSATASDNCSNPITAQKLIDAGLITKFASGDAQCGVGVAKCIKNPWGGNIDVQPSFSQTGINSSGPQYVTIKVNNIPDVRTCNLLLQDMQSVAPNGIQGCHLNLKPSYYYVEL